jgi:hypothetical protein
VIRSLPNGSRVQVEVPFGRATQIFHLSEQGKFQIIHEHLSSAEPVTPKQLPADPYLQEQDSHIGEKLL